MKMVILLYLEDDEAAVQKMLAEHQVRTFSRLPIEGHGAGTAGWYGEVAPYDARMVFTLVPEDRAAELMAAVRSCTDCQDPRHPVHAVQVSVDDIVHSKTDGDC